MIRQLSIAAVLGTTVLGSNAIGQIIPQDRSIDVVFTGVVTSEIGETIKIRQPDGSLSTYTGPVPNFPYRKGDEVTVGFTTRVPTAAFYQARPGLRNESDIYSFNITGPNNGDPGIFGFARGLDVSGAINPTQNFGQSLGTNGLRIIYDFNTDQYSLDLGDNGWSAGLFDGPGLSYDPATATLSAVNSSCFGSQQSGCNREGRGGLRIGSDNLNSIGGSDIPIWTPVRLVGGGPFSQIAGIFSLSFGGSWNLPSFGGGPVDVPEPSMMLLFGAGAGAVVWRRRRKTKRRE